MTPTRDYFALFDLPRAYRIDPAALEAAYERLSFECHPDFFAAAPQVEQERAEQRAAGVNRAYRTLRSEPARAAYLLEQLAQGLTLDNKHLLPGFLQRMFILQEEIDELEEAPHPARRAELVQEVEREIVQTRAERARLFAAVGEGADPETLQRLQTNLNGEKYLLRLQERLAGEDTAP